MYGDTQESYRAQWKYDTPQEIILRRGGSDVSIAVNMGWKMRERSPHFAGLGPTPAIYHTNIVTLEEPE